MGTIAGRVIAPRRRFRIVDRVYHGWQGYRPEEALSDHSSRASLIARIIARILGRKGGRAIIDHVHHSSRVSLLAY